MYRLSRARFDSVGHRDARLDPLTLDLRGRPGEPPLDTALWLRNMGGKTTTLALLFSVLQPDARRFLGRERAGEKRELARYVQPDDVAHVVLEWWAPESGSLPGLQLERRLVVGQVLWYRRAQGAELERYFYSFRPVEGVLTFDDLQFRDGLRRIPGRAFLERLSELQRGHAELEAVVEQNQGAWLGHLESLGLDPAIFHYQLRMNEQEGGARKFLDFRDGDSFVDLLLDVVTDPATVESVAETLGQVAEKLALKPLRETERDFSAGVAQRLRPVGAAWSRLQSARRLQADLRARGRRLRQRIARAAATALAERQDRLDEGERHARDAAAAGDQQGGLERAGRELVLQAGELRLAAAGAELAAAREVEARTAHLVRAWQAAEPLHDRRRLQAEAEARDRLLAEREAGSAAERAAHRAAAERLRSGLLSLAGVARRAVAAARDEAAAAARQAEEARDQAERAHGQLATLDAEWAHIRRELAGWEAELAGLRGEGVLAQGEPAADGLGRAGRDRDGCDRRVAEIDARKAEREQARRQAEAERADLAERCSRSEARLAAAVGLRRGLEQRVAELAGAPRLAELSEGGVDLPGGGRLLVERLLAARAQTSRELIDLRVATLSDRRARDALAERGLLPAEPDVEAAVASLRDRGLHAASGWQYVADNVGREHWPAVLAGLPWALPAVVVDPGRSAEASEALRESRCDPTGLLLLVESPWFHLVVAGGGGGGERGDGQGSAAWPGQTVSAAGFGPGADGRDGHLAEAAATAEAALGSGGSVAAVPEEGDGAGRGLPAPRAFVSRPALYDRAEAGAAELRLTERLGRAEAEESELTALAEADERLLAAVQGLLRDCPPGRIEELAAEIEGLGAQDAELRRRRDAAGDRARAAALEFEELDREQGRLARRSAALAGIVARLEAASRREAACASLPARREAIGAERALASEARQRAQAAGERAHGEEGARLEQAARAEAEAAAYQDEADQVPTFAAVATDEARPAGDARPADEARPAEDVQPAHDARSLQVLRAEYDAARRAYEERTTRSQLEDERARLTEGVAARDRELAAFPEGVLETAGELLEQAGGTRGARRVGLRRASDHAAEAVRLRVEADERLRRAHESLAEALAASGGERLTLPAVWSPADLRDAELKLLRLHEQVEGLAVRRAEAEGAGRAAEAAAREAGRRHELLQRDVDLLDRTPGLGGPAGEWDAAPHAAAAGTDALAGSEGRSEAGSRAGTEAGSEADALGVEEAHAEADALVGEVGTAAEAAALAARELGEAASEVRRFASGRAFEALPETARERFRALDDAGLGAAAEEQADELERRAGFLDHELTVLAQDRAIVVESLLHRVEAALASIAEVQRMPLPDGLGEWSGRRYLRIRFSRPDSVEEMKLRLAGLVEGLAVRRAQVDGMELLRQGVRAVNRDGRFDVTVLKPNDGLRLERAPVSEFVAWSGGQKLTTAILIYCALVRLRALNRRGPAGPDNVLVLDNPIGEANLFSLVDLQLKVARALGVQLIYATGLNDASALAAFPNVIRLRNLAHGNRRYVVPDGQPGLVQAARVWRLGSS